MDLSELQKIEREHFEAVCCISETGGLSLVEVADTLARLNARLIASHRSALEKPSLSVHRERYVPYERPRQQSLPFAASGVS